jgi:CHASE2 domain-containing sensor protein
LVFAIVLGLRTAGALEALGLAAYDWDILLRPASARPAPPVVLVTVTEEDIQRLGTWPLTDDVSATVIENLSRAGARVIGHPVRSNDDPPVRAE